ncbi:large subunit ribosomal protein L28e [Angomonas deanei]|uniref:Ribosomal L28e protein family, putative n=1 Tax=Angomonas deanei TaxID=59799 RepID=S9WF10_9TRYP|nr:large subunit ribosomal protein L28e [Angomonas deanei]EPY37761.1 large subunit ribosomal protein L28e [Angomonas deanei]EPY38293.1 large subunit ribosomal protein L28e [Angomonas deanei]EPY38431.1 large subunit ribosomal protein L28e [Angomonas deanei]CAD2222753.1 Ribosomal L28e protein family, putative [Angomonas deanei]|eukprot:EPY37344.1 large subunit ribosomal protein L28e [Angomonas deanei]
MSHSADLQWILVRQNSRFLQKRGGYRLSNDPFNNNANWTKRQSGFINDTAAVVKPGKKGSIVLTVKDGKNNNKPKQTYTKKVQPAGVKASAVSKAAAELRPDQADVTFRRARRFARLASREKKVRDARKALSATKKFARKAVRPKRK